MTCISMSKFAVEVQRRYEAISKSGGETVELDVVCCGWGKRSLIDSVAGSGIRYRGKYEIRILTDLVQHFVRG